MSGPARRPARLVVVTGTGTGVGKTWWTAAAASALRERGVRVAARKPVQSYAPGDGPTDADVLAAATGSEPEAVCPRNRWYQVAMAPPMAADALGRPPFAVVDLCRETVWPDAIEIGFVEGAGGPRSPLAADGDTVDLAAALAADAIVLVADAGLGTVNAVRLAMGVLAPVAPVTVVLNRYDGADELHRRNRAWLAERDGFTVVDTVDGLLGRLAPA
ncbi:MAG TPA: AAA family ATPase [Acidimicrobiia bacterium]|nr:AAA family ATPase [Acidimicrobiia bacterium]